MCVVVIFLFINLDFSSANHKEEFTFSTNQEVKFCLIFRAEERLFFVKLVPLITSVTFFPLSFSLKYQMASRFILFEEEDIEAFIELEENDNTKRKTKTDMTLLTTFLESQSERRRRLEDIPPEDLDPYMSRFILSVRKQNGDEYEPTSLRRIIASFDRYLKRRRYSQSIITGQVFAKTREVLKSKQKQLKKLGKGNKPQEVSGLTDTDRYDLQ